MDLRASIGPVSSPTSIFMMVTPVSSSPCRMAALIGAAPRQRGSSEAWTLRQPKRGRSSTSFLRICQNAATTIRSGFQARNCSMASGVRNFSGCMMGIPNSCATILTGGDFSPRPRPEARSGCVTTPTSSYTFASARKLGNAKSGEPINTTLVMLSLYQPGRADSAHVPKIRLIFVLFGCTITEIQILNNSEELMSQEPMMEVTSDDKLWALLAYVLTPLVPIIILLMEDKKNRPFIRAHNAQALAWGLF